VKLTPRQISAAMALAGLNQDELASEAELSRPHLTRILNGETIARDGTLDQIRRALEAHNIDFTSDEGVRIKSNAYETLVGPKGLQQFFNNVHAHAQQHGGTIIQFGVDEKQFLDHLGTEFSADYVKRMQQVSEQQKTLKVLAIICEGETEYLAPDYNEYRWISKEFFQAVPFYIYGDTLAIMDFQTVPSPTITLLKSRSITSAYRKQFDAFWHFAKEMPKQSKKGKGS
jgi:transcriptional regulator with XRE-family HTH domain